MSARKTIATFLNSDGGILLIGLDDNGNRSPVFFSRDNEEIFYVRVENATQSLKPSEVLAYVDHRK